MMQGNDKNGLVDENFKRLLQSAILSANTAYPGITENQEKDFLDTAMELNNTNLFGLSSSEEICIDKYSKENKIEPPNENILSELKKFGLNYKISESGHPSFFLKDGWSFVEKNIDNGLNISEETKKYLSNVFESASKDSNEKNKTSGKVMFTISTLVTIVGLFAATAGGSIVVGMMIAGAGMGLQRLFGVVKNVINKNESEQHKEGLGSINTKLQSANIAEKNVIDGVIKSHGQKKSPYEMKNREINSENLKSLKNKTIPIQEQTMR